jgi:hypothetical protein
MTKFTTPDLERRIMSATRNFKFGAIIACAAGVADEACPRFVGKASVTSDGFVMCDFVDHDGDYHHGAFVGAMADLTRNITGLTDHLGLDAKEGAELGAVLDGWTGSDHRQRKC